MMDGTHIVIERSVETIRAGRDEWHLNTLSAYYIRHDLKGEKLWPLQQRRPHLHHSAEKRVAFEFVPQNPKMLPKDRRRHGPRSQVNSLKVPHSRIPMLLQYDLADKGAWSRRGNAVDRWKTLDPGPVEHSRALDVRFWRRWP